MKNELMKATLTFKNKSIADKFIIHWGRKTLTGHTMSAVKVDGSIDVIVYDVCDDKKKIIEDFIKYTSEGK